MHARHLAASTCAAKALWSSRCPRAPDYHGAFVLDPDGHDVEVVNHNR
jgi:hypothetical protein